jgi:DNA-binding response OmpR family regulator
MEFMTRSDAVEQPRSERCTTPPSWPVGASCNRKLQVLLIDDEIEQLLPLADVLRRAGIAPTIATSDEEAIFDVQMSQPDVVVLDAEMADHSLISRLRALASKLPLVLMISVPSREPQIAAMLEIAGVSGIEKPVDARRLLGLLCDARRCSAIADRT